MVFLGIVTLLLLALAVFYYMKRAGAGDIIEREAIIIDKWMESSGTDSADAVYQVVFQLCGTHEEMTFETDAAVYGLAPGTRGILSYRKGEFKGFLPARQSGNLKRED